MESQKDASSPARLPILMPAPAAITSLPVASHSACPANSAHWSASAQAYHSTGGTQPSFYLPIWGGQHVMPLYGNPMPSPMYASSAVYMHPSMSPGMGYLAGESKGAPDAFVGRNETSCLREEDALQIFRGAKDDSYDPRDGSGPQGNFRRSYFKDATQEGEPSQPATAALTSNNTDGLTFTGRGRPPKLPVWVPWRIGMPNAGDDMAIWNPPHVGGVPLNVGCNTVIAPVEPGFYDAMSKNYYIQDEHKLKRGRRKQHSKESLIRPRFPKQQKIQELARRVAKLRGENAELRIELEQIQKFRKDLEAQNQHISEVINSICKKSSSN